MVILADNVFLGADVQPAQHALQKGPLLHLRHVHTDVPHFGRAPLGFQVQLGHAVVHEVHIQRGHHAFAVAHFKAAGFRKIAQGRGLHVHTGSQLQKLLQFVRGHGQGHTLLRLGEQDLPGPQAVVLEGGLGDVQHAAARIFGHFAHGGREAARAVVRNGVVQTHIPRAQNKVIHLALRNRVADLHGRGRGAFVQLFGGKGGPVDAVLADAAASHDNDVARLGLLVPAGAAVDFCRQQPHGAAKDQGLAQKALVKDQRAVDRGNAGLVAAVLHAFAHAFQHAAGVQQARGQGLVIKGRGKAEHIRIADQFRTHARAHGVAVHAHNARKRPAVGVQG